MKYEMQFKTPKYRYECMWCLSLEDNTGTIALREIQPALYSSLLATCMSSHFL